MKSKNKNLFLKIYILFLIITIITLIILQILGSKNRVGYLTDFSLVVDKTMKLKNSENITNYVYHFRIMYYDKVFRHNDIYGVYLNTNNLPNYYDVYACVCIPARTDRSAYVYYNVNLH